MTWREKVRPIISSVIQETGTDDMKALRKALRKAYPFGERKYHPYRIWCDEIKVQLGLKKFGQDKANETKQRKQQPPSNQISLLGDTENEA